MPEIGKKTIVSSVILLAMFLLSSFHILPLVACVMVAAGLMLVFKCCRMNNVIKYIEWELLLILGSTVVFSTAIANTGIADLISEHVIDVFGENPYVVMAVMCLLASLLSEFVNDLGAVAVFFPVVYQEAIALGCDPMPFVISLMLSVTTSFASPIGSSTHMLIYGPGGFKFYDFIRIGVWMHILLLIDNLFIVNIIYPIH